MPKKLVLPLLLALSCCRIFAQTDPSDSIAVLSSCPSVYDFFNNPTRIRATTGTYYNPDTLTPSIDSLHNLYNPWWEFEYCRHSKHLLITDTNYTDPYIPSLRTIPSGETASMRLGDLYLGGSSQRISFLYHVDTTVSDMLILKYAAVLEVPNHDFYEQPKFTFQTLDSAGNEIDSLCYSAIFIADSSLGWLEDTIDVHYSSHYRAAVLWKPWTTVGIRLNDVHGQTIRIVLTTYDCLQAGHFGYAYFTLGCSLFGIVPDYCGTPDTFAFHAPEGFNYTWYSPSNPDSILSSSRHLYTTTPGTYTCRIHFIGAPIGTDCYTEMNCYTKEAFPRAELSLDTLDTVECDVRFLLHSHNHIFLVENGDTTHTNLPSHTRWILDDIDTLDDLNPIITLDSGLHKVMLLAYLGQDDCFDTITQWLQVGSFCHCHDTIHDTIVQNALPWQALGQTFYTETDTVIFHQGSHEWVDGVVGCDSIYDYHLRIWPNLTDTILYYLCPDNLPFTLNGHQLSTEGCTPIDTLLGSHGEDSTVVACLHILPTSDTTLNDTIVDTQLPWPFLDSLFTDSVTDCIFHLYNEAGCDSTIHYNLHIYWNGDHCDTSLSYPNVVTPNGDGVNDRFVIGGLLENNCFKYNELTIYNRYGRMVYHRRNIHDENDWWAPNKHTPADTYFYYFKAHGINIWTQHRGVIVLLRDK